MSLSNGDTTNRGKERWLVESFLRYAVCVCILPFESIGLPDDGKSSFELVLLAFMYRNILDGVRNYGEIRAGSHIMQLCL